MLKRFKIACFIVLLIAGNLFRVYVKKSSFYYISFFSEEGPFNVSMSKPTSFQGVVEKQLKSTENVIKNTAKHATIILTTTSLKTTLSSATLLKTSSSLSSSSSSSFKAEHKKERPLLQTKNDKLILNISSSLLGASEVLKRGNGIIFVETTDRLQPPSLVLCALESAARVYNDRPVVFFMKGLEVNNTEEVAMNFAVLKSFKNLHIFPLRMLEVFSDTPLIPWYRKVNPEKEIHWIHVSSDGCRLALVWKYGGIYFDSDVISIRRIPHDHFLAAQGNRDSSNGIFGFTSHYELLWRCMEDFVKNYHGGVWGHQGPQLINRVLKQFCTVPSFSGEEDTFCGNITFLHISRFFPIPYFAWGKYFQVWEKEPSFEKCYGVHLWNYMIKGRKTMEPGSSTLVEHLYQKYCPSIYADLRK